MIDMTNYKEAAHQVCEALGGKDNIAKVFHCATRLRVILADDNKVDLDAIKAVEGVSGAVKSGSQWQIVIGKDVAEFCRVFKEEFQLVDTEVKKKFNLKNTILDIGTYVQGSVGPMIVTMVGFSMLKAILVLLSSLAIVDSTNATYTFIFGAADAGMYFLPVLLSYGAAKQLNCNPVMTVLLSLMMVSPTYTAAVSAGETLSLFGINVPMYNYSQQFLPVLLVVPIYAVIERYLKKYVPEILQMIIVPVLSLLIMIPIIFLGIGTIMTGFTNLMAVPCEFIAHYRLLAIPVMAVMWTLLTIFGAHGSLFFVITALYFDELGYDPVCLTSYLSTHLTIGFVALMSAFLSKDKGEKQVGISTGITMLFACISEPAIFGVLLRDKRLFAAQLSAAFTTGIFIGLSGLKCFMIGPNANLLCLPTYIGEGSSALTVALAVVTALVTSALFSMLYKGAFPYKKAV